MWPIRNRAAAMIDALGPHTLKHFRLEEFACPCCGMAQMDGNFLLMIDQAREIAGVPFTITSGYRCEKHNRAVGGVASSSHLTGKAADISTAGSGDRFAIVDAAMGVGFNRMGMRKDFIHVDNDCSKAQCKLWLYY